MIIKTLSAQALITIIYFYAIIALQTRFRIIPIIGKVMAASPTGRVPFERYA